MALRKNYETFDKRLHYPKSIYRISNQKAPDGKVEKSGKNNFKTHSQQLEGKHILLVDDVIAAPAPAAKKKLLNLFCNSHLSFDRKRSMRYCS